MEKETMTVREMGELLGLQKVAAYYLLRRADLRTIVVNRKTRIYIDSFEEWYDSQTHYRKVNGDPPGRRIRELSYDARDVAALLGTTPKNAYETIFPKEELEKIVVSNVTRVTRSSFWKWYRTQNHYRTVEDREADSRLLASTITMPEMARVLGVSRNYLYRLIRGAELEEVPYLDQKRFTKESFYRWYDTYENTLTIPEAAELLHVDLNRMYRILEEDDTLEVIRYASKKRITKESFWRYYQKMRVR